MSNAIFPENFIPSLANAPGFNAENFLKIHEVAGSPTAIRLNPFKYTEGLKKLTGQQVPWCAEGYYLEKRPSFTFDPLFHAGCYYVQEASSMFIAHILQYIRKNNPDPIKVLDLCAAPGGKSTLLSSALNQDDLLVANEIIKTRVPVLTDNLAKWGPSNTIVSNNDPKDFSRLKDFFDIVLVDAPCSGSGMFRKDPDAMQEWSLANVNLCHQRQERILADIYPAINKDGYLIYSTCSYSVAENEEILDWLCAEFDMESIRIPINPEWHIVESTSTQHKAYGYRFYPDQVAGEGLFAACLRKTGNNSSGVSNYKSKNTQKPDYKSIDLLKPYIKNADNYYYFKVNDDWLAIDRLHKDSMSILQQHLYLKKSGVRLGSIAGRDLIPDHELAMSLLMNKEAVLETALTLEQAIAYLRRDNINDLELTQKGWSLMTYENYPLGWAKLLPNRINNYYPKEMRILASPPPPLEGGAFFIAQ